VAVGMAGATGRPRGSDVMFIRETDQDAGV
jgi:hypothetical protein